MQFEGALIKEQGVAFAVVVVKPFVLSNQSEAERTISDFQRIFQRPVVLMAQDHRGVPTFYGRRDISSFMANVPLSAVPWKKFTVN